MPPIIYRRAACVGCVGKVHVYIIGAETACNVLLS